MRKLLVAAALAAFTFFTLCPEACALAGLPKDHKKFMKNGDYAEAYEQFSATMKEAEERLESAEYAELDRENGREIAESVAEDTASGDFTEMEAYASAYWMRGEYVSKYLVWDWLKRNAEGVLGFYRLKSGDAEGYLTVEESDEEGLYAVYATKTAKGDRDKTADLRNFGKLEGNKMTVGDEEEEEYVLTVVFDGETAIVKGLPGQKDDFLADFGILLDGEYVREKK